MYDTTQDGDGYLLHKLHMRAIVCVVLNAFKQECFFDNAMCVCDAWVLAVSPVMSRVANRTNWDAVALVFHVSSNVSVINRVVWVTDITAIGDIWSSHVS
jgi:hypothetical protein